MNSRTKLWSLGALIVSIALILFGIAGGLLPQLAAASTTDDLTDSAQMRNDTQRAQIEMLREGQGRSAKLKADAAELSRALPDTAASAELLRELEENAANAEVQLTSVLTSTPVSPVDEPDAAAADAAAADAATGEAPAADAETDQAAAETAPPQAAGHTTIPLIITAEGSHEALARFTHAVQTGGRLIVVNQIDITEGSEGGSLVTITGLMFIVAE